MEDVATDLGKLSEALAQRDAIAYVLTVTDEGTPHATYSPVRWEKGRLVADVGKQTAHNALARNRVSLLFPARTPEDYSLIVDGTATSDINSLTVFVQPTRAILHRHGQPSHTGTVCSDDCIPLFPSKPSTARAR